MSVVWSKIGAFPWPSQKEKNKTSGGTAALFVSVDQQDMVLHCFLLHNQIKMHHFNNHWLTSFGYPRLYVTSQTWDYMSFALSCPWRLWVDSSQMVQCPMLLGQRLRRHGSQGKRWRSHTFEKMWRFCCSFKELEDVVAMSFFGICRLLEKIDVATWRASCERNTLKGLDK